MTQQLKLNIRETLLSEVRAQEPSGPSAQNLEQSLILEAVARRLGVAHNPKMEAAILTQWNDLFRTGLLSWGLNIANPNPPFFHLTERGRAALENVTRDPSNPAGYLRHLASIATLEPVAKSYVGEGLECYVAGLFKAAAVMVGAAAESIILNLRDQTIKKLGSIGRPVPRDMEDWRIKIVSDALWKFFGGHASRFERPLRESFEAYWPAFIQQIRTTRNDAGHPTSVDPVTPDTVHAALLIFPEFAGLANGLSGWVRDSLT